MKLKKINWLNKKVQNTFKGKNTKQRNNFQKTMGKNKKSDTKNIKKRKQKKQIKKKIKKWKWINVKKTKTDKRIPKKQILKLNQKQQKTINKWKTN
jgi:hypothetical protein